MSHWQEQAECLAYALRCEREGFWGGYSARERRAYRRSNRIILMTPQHQP